MYILSHSKFYSVDIRKNLRMYLFFTTLVPSPSPLELIAPVDDWTVAHVALDTILAHESSATSRVFIDGYRTDEHPLVSCQLVAVCIFVAWMIFIPLCTFASCCRKRVEHKTLTEPVNVCIEKV